MCECADVRIENSRKGIFLCASAYLREIKCRPTEMQEL